MRPNAFLAGVTKSRYAPLLLLLIVSLVAGLLTFGDYGLSWDEPLFYDYAEALGYAYNPANWFRPDFDLTRAYGPSGDDHKTRGPAYLLLARGPAALLQFLGLDRASAWHLVNFLFFQLGVFFLYRLCLRWVKPWAAFGGAALFSAQPLLWGHAFINPKDPSFMIFFLGSVMLGFEMVDALAENTKSRRKQIALILLSALSLGLTTSIRVLGPLAGLLVAVYALWRLRWKALPVLLFYGILASLVTLLTWPYLWEDPLGRFLEVMRFMSANPTGLTVLFNGAFYRAYELPRRYLPLLLGVTLTEPLWPLFTLGLISTLWKLLTDHWKPITDQLASLLLILAWFVIPFLYVIVKKPPMYDGFRHFLFILPSVFVIIALAIDWLFGWIVLNWLRAAIVVTLLTPGIFAIINLHPYQYTYYNSYVGWTGGAFRRFETDYWLTCYKEAVEQFNEHAPEQPSLYVRREAYIAAYYAADGIAVREYRGNLAEIRPGDYVLVNTRSNEDLKTFRDAAVVLEVGRQGAIFCIIKQIH